MISIIQNSLLQGEAPALCKVMVLGKTCPIYLSVQKWKNLNEEESISRREKGLEAEQKDLLKASRELSIINQRLKLK